MQGSSSGTGHEGSYKIELKAYVSHVEVQGRHSGTYPVMVSITAESPTAAGKGMKRPIDLVVVLNVYEKGMKRQKLLVEAVNLVVEKLNSEAYDSRLAIVGGESTLLPMTSQSNAEAATKAVMAYYPLSSHTYTSMARALASAEKILYRRIDEDKVRRAGHIILISDSQDDVSSLLTWRFPWVSSFGFRDEGNARTMHSIATNPGCTYALLDDEHGCLTQALAATIDRITCYVAAEVKLMCECDKTVEIASIDAPRINYFISYDNKVAAEMVRMEAFMMIAYIIAIADDKNLYMAADELHQRWKLLKKSKYGKEAGEAISAVAAEMGEMETRLYNNYLWLEYMLSWQSHQQWQLPLPPLFMDQQPSAAGDHVLRTGVFAAIPETFQKGGLASPLAVLVRVVVPKSALAKVKRAPVDLIAVLDATCGCTEPTRIKKLLVKATDVVMKKLGDKDGLAVIHVQSADSATEPDVAPSRLLEISSKVSKVHTTSADDDNKTNNSPQILDDRPSEEKNRPGFIIVVSDIEDDSISGETLVTTKYTMHTFGFRGSGPRNTRAMKYIASTSKDGIYGVLNDHQDDIAKEFSTCIDKIISIVTMRMTLYIDIAENSREHFPHAVLSTRLLSWAANDRKSGSIFAGDLYAGTTRGFIVYVENIGKVFDYYNLYDLLTVHVKWLNASTGVQENVDGDRLVVMRQEEMNTMRSQLLA
ncbi:unnamed protein product [Alopecurus aequalis]